MKIRGIPIKIKALLNAVLVAACLHSGSATAASIIDTVLADGKEWAQINLFTSLSWNDVNAVCPGGVCGGGQLNGYDMAGWTWANVSQANSLLNYSIGSDLLGPGPDVAEQADSTWGPAIFGAGFIPTETASVGQGTYRGMYALTSAVATINPVRSSQLSRANSRIDSGINPVFS